MANYLGLDKLGQVSKGNPVDIIHHYHPVICSTSIIQTVTPWEHFTIQIKSGHSTGMCTMILKKALAYYVTN